MEGPPTNPWTGPPQLLPCPAAGSPQSEDTARCSDPGLRYLVNPGTPGTWELHVDPRLGEPGALSDQTAMEQLREQLRESF